MRVVLSTGGVTPALCGGAMSVGLVLAVLAGCSGDGHRRAESGGGPDDPERDGGADEFGNPGAPVDGGIGRDGAVGGSSSFTLSPEQATLTVVHGEESQTMAWAETMRKLAPKAEVIVPEYKQVIDFAT